jgi:EmrB/QacA subfamily drug resistance transporter
LLCAVAPTPEFLIAARIAQGVAGALLTPGSLAIIQASFVRDDRGRAIGLWAGIGAAAPALGPPLGGLLAEYDWRWVFLINIPLAVLALVLSLRFVPESRDPESSRELDWTGAVLGVVFLAGLTYALTEAGGGEGRAGSALPAWMTWLAAAVAVLSGAAFVWWMRRARNPMVPPSLFANRTFTVTNLYTLGVYAALAALFFFLSLQLQTTLGYRPLYAGLAGLPSTIIMIFLSERAGALTTRVGPRLPLVLGPLLAAAGTLWLAFLDEGDAYLSAVLPGVLLFGIGLAFLVAPLTTTVLAAAPDRLAGTASGVNNAVARAAGLVAVAALPALVGLSARDYEDPAALTDGYLLAMLITTGVLVAGALSALLIPRQLEDCRPG